MRLHVVRVLIMRGRKTGKAAWDETSRGVRARPVGLDRKYVHSRVFYVHAIAQLRTLTRGVRVMHIHDRAT